MNEKLFLRAAPWVVLLVVAYVVGRWHGDQVAKSESAAALAAEQTTVAPAVAAASANAPAAATPAAPSREARLVAEVDAVAAAARVMAAPDARTYAFFENLEPDDLEPVAGYIEQMPAGNEQDVLFVMVMRRWAQLDGPAALTRAERFPALVTRANARLAAFEAWGAHDGAAAMARALQQSDEQTQARAAAAVLGGAATTDVAAAVALWESAPEKLRESGPGLATLQQLTSAACATGKRETVQALVEKMPEGEPRTRMITTLVQEWGTHYPDDAYAWLGHAVTDATQRESITQEMFTRLSQQDPSLAATWAAAYPEDGRRPGYIAAAVSEWAELDAEGAETWVNEQPTGGYLDLASYAIATHFMTRRDMSRSFAWIRRINQNEARAEMLGNLGQLWSKEHPEEFRKFLDETSLNRAEVEMLLSKIEPAS